jgi:hypothetical protein
VNWREMKIVAAAVWKTAPDDVKEGLIFTLPAPARHHNILHMMSKLGITQDHTVTQGFLTDTGDFVRRKPAMMIARAAGQMKPREPGQYDGEELFSEDLW